MSQTSTPGDTVGPQPSSWQLSNSATGFVVCGGSYAGATRVMAAVPEGLIRFELIYTLSLGGSASAWLLEWDGSAWEPSGTVITVDDWYESPGMWQGLAGYQGFAVKHPALQRYEIVWMETPARSIEFMLLSPMSGGQALASVQKSYLQGKAPPSIVTVYDDTANYPRALTGAAGKAAGTTISPDTRLSSATRWRLRCRANSLATCALRPALLVSPTPA